METALRVEGCNFFCQRPTRINHRAWNVAAAVMVNGIIH